MFERFSQQALLSIHLVLVGTFFGTAGFAQDDVGGTSTAIVGGTRDGGTLAENATVYIHLAPTPGPTATSARCTGTLIAENIVLSAGHCFDRQNLGPRPVDADRFGGPNPSDWANPKQWYPLYNRLPEGVQIHIGNDAQNWLQVVNARYWAKPGYADMILYKLDGPVSRDAAVPATPLLNTRGRSIDWSEQDFRLAGWGFVDGGSTVLPRFRRTTTASNGTIQETGPWPARCGAPGSRASRRCGCIPNKMCVTPDATGTSALRGDSGGPLYWTDPDDGQTYVIGDLQDTLETYVLTFGKGGVDSSGIDAPDLGAWIANRLERTTDNRWYDQTGSGNNEAGDLMGSAMIVGDFINTGTFNSLDIAVGAPGEDYAGSGPNAGVVFLFSREVDALRPAGYLTQDGAGLNEAGDRFGSALASADVVGSDLTDLLVGAPGEDYRGSGSYGGVVFVFPGQGTEFGTPQLITQSPAGETEAGDGFGFAIETGDFNGDGNMDVAVGAPGDASPTNGAQGGGVYIFAGTRAGLAPPVRLSDESGFVAAGDRFGHALASGDFDGNGIDDLAVGAPGRSFDGTTTSGTVQIAYGSAAGLGSLQTLGQAPAGRDENGDAFGFSLAAGDFDRDGADDLAVGAPGENFAGSGRNEGVVFLFAGVSGGVLAEPTLLTQEPIGRNESGDRFGTALTVGDLNGDSYDDLAIGAPGENYRGSGPSAGVYYTALGTQDGLLAAPMHFDQLAGRNEAHDRFGAALATGQDEWRHGAFLLVGAPGENVRGSGPDAGVVHYVP